MQAYRIADITDQDRVSKKFQDVKDWINEKFIKQNGEMFEALKGIYAIRGLLFYPVKIQQEHLGEAIAVCEAIKKIELLIKEIEND